MGVQGASSGAGNFPGTQQFLNNAIGSENYIAQGGLQGPINSFNQGQQGQIANYAAQNLQPQSYSPVGFGGGYSAAGYNNPYATQAYNAAVLPITQNYQNSVMPNIVGGAAASGGVGGSGANNAVNLANSGLGQALGNAAAGIYEPIAQQSQALTAQGAEQTQALQAQAAMQAQQLGAQSRNLGEQLGTGLFGQGLGNAAGLYGQGLNLTQSAIGNAPSLAAGAYIPSQEMYASGQQGQNQAQNVLNTAYQNLFGQSQWPYQALGMLGQGLSTVGGLGGGQNVNVQSGLGGFK